MILPNDSDGCAPRSKAPTPPPAPQPPAPEEPWRIAHHIRVVIEIPPQDATTPAEAAKCARDLAAALELKVTLGGVPLPANFSDSSPVRSHSRP